MRQVHATATQRGDGGDKSAHRRNRHPQRTRTRHRTQVGARTAAAVRAAEAVAILAAVARARAAVGIRRWALEKETASPSEHTWATGTACFRPVRTRALWMVAVASATQRSWAQARVSPRTPVVRKLAAWAALQRARAVETATVGSGASVLQLEVEPATASLAAASAALQLARALETAVGLWVLLDAWAVETAVGAWVVLLLDVWAVETAAVVPAWAALCARALETAMAAEQHRSGDGAMTPRSLETGCA
jgi:hypothetical protein